MSYSPAEYRGLTFHDAAARFSTGDDTPRAYLERCLATIAEREPEVKAWVRLNEKGAREAADAATTRYQAGSPLSPIDGLPIGIKDGNAGHAYRNGLRRISRKFSEARQRCGLGLAPGRRDHSGKDGHD